MPEHPNLHELARHGELLFEAGKEYPVQAFGREEMLAAIRPYLEDDRRHSFILVGDSGCGKTAIIQEFARRQAAKADRPWLVLRTSTSLLLADTLYSGELETRVKSLISAARRPQRVAVYFTDVTNLLGAGKTAKSDESIGSFLANYISSGDVVLIGECSPLQVRKGLDQDPSFKRLFHLVRLTEPTEAATREIVKSVAAQRVDELYLETGCQVHFPEAVLDRVQEIGRAFFPGQANPGRSVRLLEHVAMLEKERLGDHPADSQVEVSPAAVIHALERQTGVPRVLLDDSEPLDLEKVRDFFEAHVLGQREAVSAVVDMITLIKAGLADPTKPLGVLLFVGPTGVGKTELAKAIAEFIFGSPDRMVRFDLSEYKDYHSFEKLIGHNRDSNNGSHGGSLTSAVRQQPFSVILFDELEKAHPNVFDVFLQLFDDGRLTDAAGETTSFTQTIVIMTSNLGSNLDPGFSMGFLPPEQPDLHEEIDRALAVTFRPEFLGRIDRVVRFMPLGRPEVQKLARRELGKVLNRSGIIRRNLRVDVDPAVEDVIMKEGFNQRLGARPMKRAVENLVLLPLARQIARLGADCDPVLRLLVHDGKVSVRTVETAEVRKPETAAAPAIGQEPAKKRKPRISRDEIQARAHQLQERVAALVKKCEDDGLATRKSGFLQVTQRPDFWDDQANARQVNGEIHRIDKILEQVKRLQTRADDLFTHAASPSRNNEEAAVHSLAERATELERMAAHVGYMLFYASPLEEGDAIVCIALVDRSPAEDDVVGLLADMYLNWAKQKGFAGQVIHESVLESGLVQSITLFIEGSCVYGVLRDEDGFHEMHYGRTSKTQRANKMVRVRVLPFGEEVQAVASAAELVTEFEPAKGTGSRVKRYKSKVSVTHHPTLAKVECTSALDQETAKMHATRWLLAELFSRQQSSAAGTLGSEQPVRRYTFRPTPGIKDLRTGHSKSGLADLWKGGLDEFLSIAGKLARLGTESAGAGSNTPAPARARS